MESNISKTLLAEIFPEGLSKAQRTRLAIIEGAIHCYASTGIEKTTFETIAKKCKISRPLIQHYFKDRDELNWIALKFIRGRFQKYCVDRMELNASAEMQLLSYARATFSWIDEYNLDARVWLLFFYYCGFKRGYRTLNTELVSQGHARIQALLSKGIKEGCFQDGAISKRAKLIQNVLTGGLLIALTESSEAVLDFNPTEALIEHCLELARGISFGVR